MTSALSDQKLLSASRNSRLPNNQPSAAMATNSAMGTIPISAGVSFPASLPAHTPAISGTSPTITAGTMNRMSQATTSLARLISPSKLPAIVRSELDLVLDASSSMSPCRGSTNGCMRPLLFPGGSPTERMNQILTAACFLSRHERPRGAPRTGSQTSR